MQIKNYLKLILLSLIALYTLQIYGQTTEGDATVLVDVTIVDSEEFPLAGATVQIIGKSQGVLADENGAVSLWVDKGATIEFRFLGMKPLRMKVV
ncbi:MAG TPA: hypothetical protein VKX35_08575, partial [Fermentimonas sp.]|nr:hypothetical protein [Fermentimonas sp.]